jgi:hypothetical protein
MVFNPVTVWPLATEGTAQPISQPRPHEPADIERRIAAFRYVTAGKPGIEVRGEIRNETAAKLLRKARPRKLRERPLKSVFDGQKDAGLPPFFALRRETIDDIALGA